jgi:hypothetical protein
VNLLKGIRDKVVHQELNTKFPETTTSREKGATQETGRKRTTKGARKSIEMILISTIRRGSSMAREAIRSNLGTTGSRKRWAHSCMVRGSMQTTKITSRGREITTKEIKE